MKNNCDKNLNYIISLAWCDKTSFEEIKKQTNLNYDEIKKIMKDHLKPKSYYIWKKRIAKNIKKHTKKHKLYYDY